MITFDRDELKRAVGEAALFAHDKATMPILTAVQIEPGRVRATDLGGDYSARVESAGEGPGAVVPCRFLRRYLDQTDAGRVEVVPEGAAGARFTAGDFSARGESYPAADFPTWPKALAGPTAEIACSALRSALDRLARFASLDETRPHMAQIVVYAKPLTYDGREYRFAATDGHRAMLLPDRFAVAPVADLVIPREIAERFAKIAKKENGTPLRWNAAGSRGVLSWGPREIGFRTCDAAFPPLEHVIPRPSNRQWTFRAVAKDLARALTRVAKVTEVLIVADVSRRDEGVLVVRNPDGSCRDVVRGAFAAGEGRPAKGRNGRPDEGPLAAIGLNSAYMLDAIGGADDKAEVAVHFGDAKDPAVVEAGEELHVVMPWRL